MGQLRGPENVYRQKNYLSYGNCVNWIGRQFYFHPIKQALQLILYITGSFHRTMLDIVFIAPLRRELCVLPLTVNIQQSQMVATRNKKVLPRCVSMNYFVLWSIEDGVVDGQHGSYGDNFF